MSDDALFDMVPERYYFQRDEFPFPFCSDCRRKQPFMEYAGGVTDEGHYRLCEKCAIASRGLVSR